MAFRVALPQSGVVRPLDPHTDPSLNMGNSGRGIALNVGLSVVKASLKGLTADICLLTPSPAAETSLSFLKGNQGACHTVSTINAHRDPVPRWKDPFSDVIMCFSLSA